MTRPREDIYEVYGQVRAREKVCAKLVPEESDGKCLLLIKKHYEVTN